MSPGARSRARTPWSLRRRLVLGIVGLFTLLAIVIGVVSVAALSNGLVARLDRQLQASAGRSGESLDPNGPNGDPRTDPPPVTVFLPGQGAGALGALVIDGRLERSGYIDERGSGGPLTAGQDAVLVDVPTDEAPQTVSLEGLGDYRVVATTLRDGAVVIVGLPLAEAQATTAQLAWIVVAVSAFAILLALLLGGVVVGVGLRPLTRVAATATRVSELPLEAGDVAVTDRVPTGDAAPTTEVGRVGAALNRLLDRVQSALDARNASEAKLRRFVADASHELRTPLASIRGYAELGGRTTESVPADVARSLARIESQAVRMSSLVDDLLLLARLDSGSELRRDPVDLRRLLVDAVSDAHAAGPEHLWRMDLGAGDAVEDAEPVDVLGDADRLHQVVANLLANARVHSPPGTTVTTVLEDQADEVRIRVVDDGPGIPDSLRTTLFERFARGDSSRSRSAGSTGLGLSIASAIVEAHGGTIGVDSRPGRTAFTVTLPRGTGSR